MTNYNSTKLYHCTTDKMILIQDVINVSIKVPIKAVFPLKSEKINCAVCARMLPMSFRTIDCFSRVHVNNL